MNNFSFAIALMFIFGAIAACLLVRRRSASLVPWPTKSRSVLTRREQPFYWRLQQALPSYVVLAQVQLSRFLSIDARAQRRAWLNRIDRKSADFVICKKDFSVVAVIEVDDSSHDDAAARKRDADKDAALSAAGITVLRWRQLPDVEAIRKAFEHLENNA